MVEERGFMQLIMPPDLEALVRRRLKTGAFATAEDVIRHALEALEAEEIWSDDERKALDEKIDRALQQAAAGRVYGPEETVQRLAEMRAAHLSEREPLG